MIDFLDVYLPESICRYIVGGPVFHTQILKTISGREVRSSHNPFALQEYVIKNCKLKLEEFEEFNAFFRNCRGMGCSFKMKDYSDYTAQNQDLEEEIEIENQDLGQDLGQNLCQGLSIKNFHLFKEYTFSGLSYKRRVYKPIAKSIQIISSHSQQHLSDDKYEFDYEKALLKINTQEDAKSLKVSFDFDIEVRFETDSFEYSFSDDGGILLKDIKLKEIYIAELF